ncbi:MAG TPA: phosphatase PAP2 family protein [Gaiellaceae bacterium]
MTAVAAAGRRILPKGWTDFGFQVAIWLGFYFSYQAVRSLADRDPTKAFINGFRVIGFEQRITPHLLEQTAQRIADSSGWLLTAAAWTYWNSEFTVIGLTLLWVYLRRHDHFVRFRNTILLANTIGLIGYAFVPTAPPWMFPSFGFVDGVNHSHGFIGAFANPYAAMPSLHAADALVVGVYLLVASRRWWSKALWAVWPVWVWFCVIATANHFWLDVAAGIAVGAVSLVIVAKVPLLAGRTRAPAEVPIANLL